jgi:tRNA(fMet)-specific endonuclease VapC
LIYSLDTNVVLHLANQSEGAERIERRMRQVRADNMRLSAVGFAELRFKILAGEGRVKAAHLARLEAIVSTLEVEPFTMEGADCAASIMQQLQPVGRRNEWPDVLIAGHAKAAGHMLVTDDASLLAVPGLRTVNWRAAT